MRGGFSHIGLSTLDLDRTRAFYEGVLGMPAVRCDTIELKEGGRIRHVFFDAGEGQLLAFMEPGGVQGIPGEYDAGINRGLGVPDAFYHLAFEVGSVEALEAKRADLLARGVAVSPVVRRVGRIRTARGIAMAVLGSAMVNVGGVSVTR